MKVISILILLLISSFAISQPSSRTYKNKVVRLDNNKVQVWAYCKGNCNDIKPRLVSEGYTYGKKRNDMDFVMSHKQGVWKYYDSSGKLIDSIEYVRNFRIGEYESTDTQGNLLKYSIKKEGESKITYYNSNGIKFQEDSFYLSLENLIILRIKFDKSGQVIATEKWLDGAQIE